MNSKKTPLYNHPFINTLFHRTLEEIEHENIHDYDEDCSSSMDPEEVNAYLVEQGYDLDELKTNFENLKKRISELPEPIANKIEKLVGEFAVLFQDKVSELLDPQYEPSLAFMMRGDKDENQLPLKYNHIRQLSDSNWQVRYDFPTPMQNITFQVAINDLLVESTLTQSPNGKWCIVMFSTNVDINKMLLSVEVDESKEQSFRLNFTSDC